MSRPKEEIKFLTRKEMLEYAKSVYPEVCENLNGELKSYCEENYYRKITRILEDHKLIPQGKTESETKVVSEPIAKFVSEPIAKFVVEVLLSDYFSKDSATARRRQKEREEKRREELKERSREMDEQLTKEQQKAFEDYSYIQVQEYTINSKEAQEATQLSLNSRDGECKIKCVS